MASVSPNREAPSPGSGCRCPDRERFADARYGRLRNPCIRLAVARIKVALRTARHIVIAINHVALIKGSPRNVSIGPVCGTIELRIESPDGNGFASDPCG